MLIIPIYDSIVLPHSTMYIPKENIVDLGGRQVEVNDKIIFLVCKERLNYSKISKSAFQKIGVSGVIADIDKNGLVTIDTKERINILKFRKTKIENNYEIEINLREEVDDISIEEETSKLMKMKSELTNFIKDNQWSFMVRAYIMQWKSLSEVICAISSWLPNSEEEKYALLKEDSKKKRTEKIEKMIYEYINIESITKSAKNKEDEDLKKMYKETSIRKQIDYLEKELEEMNPDCVSETSEFERKIEKSGMNKDAKKEALKVLNRLKQEGSSSQEYGMLYDYLDFMTSLSWKKEKFKNYDISKAKEVLDKEHFGLKKVKKRIIEEIAVMNLNKKQSGSILLFVGPPGTGKTSVASSIAKALNRKYVRISLGGIRDEAEIRGHRRTYLGALPGRIMSGIEKSGVSNPVIVLDEVDKLITSYDGDPASALLEVLDPEQNNTFTDHYLNVPYDLSDTLFICTANSIDKIPEPLLNRMEVIEFSGYTPIEKEQIAKEYLIPESMKKIGLTKKQIGFTSSGIKNIIKDYTMESGVRGLKRIIEHLCRESALKIVTGEENKIEITNKNYSEYIDIHKIHHDEVGKSTNSGIITGLAWTSAGGEILFIESSMTKGKGKLTITGQLGDVMKESIQIAISLIKNIYPEYVKKITESDIHIHVPEGAVPKDGPSAGITITTALASLLTNKKVSGNIAMTGEVSLRGNVMPIGGLKEKLMAAERAGVKKAFIPKDNIEDLKDIPEEIKEKIEVIPVTTVKEVLKELKLIN
ncbi:MAG: endopeptidase La [Mollicutes bacterium]|nr:endopeptidase La [Mollicutes bacterium]